MFDHICFVLLYGFVKDSRTWKWKQTYHGVLQLETGSPCEKREKKRKGRNGSIGEKREILDYGENMKGRLLKEEKIEENNKILRLGILLAKLYNFRPLLTLLLFSFFFFFFSFFFCFPPIFHENDLIYLNGFSPILPLKMYKWLNSYVLQ